MPKGQRGEKRPPDVIGKAVNVMHIATGEDADDVPAPSPAAQFGELGGAGRARNLTPDQLKGITRKGAAKRGKDA